MINLQEFLKKMKPEVLGWMRHARYNDGWLEVDETATYASATSITIPVDLADMFPVGTRLRLIQDAGTWCYFVVVSTSVDVADVCTINLTGGGTYTVANETITRLQISYMNGSQPGWPWGPIRILSMATYQALPYNYALSSNYQPYNAALDADCIILEVIFNIYVVTTNNGSNYYAYTIRNAGGSDYGSIANTSALAANTWNRISYTINVAANAATDKMVYLYLTEYGSPGNMYLTGAQVRVV